MIGIIYKFTSPSGKCYIGQTTKERARMNQHKVSSKRSNCAFYRAIRKYGFNSFIYEILYKTKESNSVQAIKRVLDCLEKAYIKYFNSFKNGYNCTDGGGGILGFKPNNQTRLKMSICKIGSKNHFYGKVHTNEAKLKIAESKLGNKSPYFGKPLPEKCNIAMLKAIQTPVLQYDLTGNFINEWKSATEAKRNTGVDNSSIAKCAKGTLKSAGNFTWKYK